MADDRPEHIDPDWWAQHLPRVRAFVKRRLRPELARLESPSDIVQSACRELLSDLDREAVLRGGIAALRKIIQKHRFHAAHKRNRGRTLLAGSAVDAVIESATDPLSRLVEGERAERLARAMQRLPERYQRIIEWVHFDRVSHAEVGRRIGKSEDACKMMLSRAMAKLAETLSKP